MKSGQTPITEADLHAYVDGQLPAERRREIDAYLAERPEEAQRLDRYLAHKRELRALFDPVLDEAVPPRLARAAGRAPWRAWPLRQLAAAVVLLLVGGGAGWGLRGVLPDGAGAWPAGSVRSSSQSGAAGMAAEVAGVTGATGATDSAGAAGTGASAPTAAFAHRAAVAHAVYSPERRRPVEVEAAHEDQLVTWLSRRLGAPIKVPVLHGLGYSLEGGRLLPGGSGPVAQLMYRDQDGKRLTLYVSNEADVNAAGHPRSPAGHTGFRFAQQGSVNVFYWVDGAFGYAISAEADRSALAAVSAEVYRQLTARR